MASSPPVAAPEAGDACDTEQTAGADALVVDLAPDEPAQWDLVSQLIADDCEMPDAAEGGMKDACPVPNRKWSVIKMRV